MFLCIFYRYSLEFIAFFKYNIYNIIRSYFLEKSRISEIYVCTLMAVTALSGNCFYRNITYICYAHSYIYNFDRKE